jgi:hypothetical protein
MWTSLGFSKCPSKWYNIWNCEGFNGNSTCNWKAPFSAKVTVNQQAFQWVDCTTVCILNGSKVFLTFIVLVISFVNVILIYYYHSQICEHCYIFKGFLSSHYLMILCCMLLSRHEHIFSCLCLYVMQPSFLCLAEQAYTNPRCQVAHATKFCTMAPNIFWSSVWCLLHVTLLAYRILRWLPDLWKICVLLL